VLLKNQKNYNWQCFRANVTKKIEQNLNFAAEAEKSIFLSFRA